MTTKSVKLDAASAAALIRPRDVLLCGFVAGQPVALLEAIGARSDLEDVTLYCGLLGRPYDLLRNPAIRVVSGFFGPVERMARAAGARVTFLPADFHGLERIALRLKPRVVLAVTTPPDASGWLSFGVHSGASFRAFLEAARDPERLAIAEVNPKMPRVEGIADLGGNHLHVSEVDAWVEHDADLVALPEEQPSPDDLAIAAAVCERIEPGATLQFGIGAIPGEIARRLAEGAVGGFGIHTEMIGDGVMRLHEAGKVSNRKPIYAGLTVATFALGTEPLYRWLDGNSLVRMLPVSAVNDPAILRRIPGLVSINGALAIDLDGQVAADSVAGRQYSGVGGHESFVIGASEAPGGTSFLCLKSTARIGGQRVSTIVATFAPGTRVTTARHHVHHVVTEQGVADLSTLGDTERPAALLRLAHPDFRDELEKAWREGPRRV
jgi:acyl-CoA hydrolase